MYDSRLVFIHQTARDFLHPSRRLGWWSGRFNLSISYRIILRSCLFNLVLLEDDFFFKVVGPATIETLRHCLIPHANEGESF